MCHKNNPVTISKFSTVDSTFLGLGLAVVDAVGCGISVLAGSLPLALLLTREMEPFPAAIDLKLSRGEFSLCLGIRPPLFVPLVFAFILCSQGVVFCSCSSDFSLQ